MAGVATVAVGTVAVDSAAAAPEGVERVVAAPVEAESEVVGMGVVAWAAEVWARAGVGSGKAEAMAVGGEAADAEEEEVGKEEAKEVGAAVATAAAEAVATVALDSRTAEAMATATAKAGVKEAGEGVAGPLVDL